MSRLLLFDLNPSGHHAGYLHHLIRLAPADGPELLVLVSPDFLTLHPQIVADAQRPGLRLLTITDPENQARLAAGGGLAQARAEWNLMVQYARQEQVQTVLLMYLDFTQPPFLTAGRLPFRVAGILFRPAFHYADWGHRPTSWREWLQFYRKKWLLQALTKRRELTTLFCLDPFVIPTLNRWAGRPLARLLPDPVPTRPVTAVEIEMLRQQLGVEAGRRIVLIFGQLDERKGISVMLQALAALSPGEQAGWCLLLVGPANAPAQAELDAATAMLQAVQVIRQADFVNEPDIHPYFALADLVAVLYQQHIGMSAVLVRASAAGRPVLAADYGLLGQLVRTKSLGKTVDATDANTIAVALKAFSRGEWGADADQMRAFAAQNKAENFAEVIFSTLLEWQKE